MKQHLQSLIQNNLTQDDLKFIIKLVELGYRGDGFEGGDYYSCLMKLQYERYLMGYEETLREKLNWFCFVFGVSSFQEVIRKILYYRLVDMKVSKEYFEYLSMFSRERFLIVSGFRAETIKLALEVPDEFIEFCVKWQNCAKKEDRVLLDNFILKIKKPKTRLNKYLNKGYKVFSKFFCLVQRDYENLFNIFKISEEDKKRTVELRRCCDDLHLEYLYILNKYLENLFPISIKRMVNKKEGKILEFLMNKGDEIDYLKENKIKADEFSLMVQEICKIYACKNINDVMSVVETLKFAKSIFA